MHAPVDLVSNTLQLDAGFCDGDLVVIASSGAIRDGEAVAAGVEGDRPTLSHFFRHHGSAELRPANLGMESVGCHPARGPIPGRVILIMRHTLVGNAGCPAGVAPAAR